MTDRNREQGLTKDGRRGQRGVSDTVLVTALGGVGEVGKNSTLLECDGKLLLIDCGVQFPSPEHLGVDLIIPDFSYVLSRPEQFVGLVLTHAHEDHIGAVPLFLREM